MGDLQQLGQRSLYVYSSDDPLCDAAKVDSLVAARRRAGHRVTAKRWAASQHVGHLRCHPEEYRQLLGAFLAEVAGAPSS